jgi:hypothetical protein
MTGRATPQQLAALVQHQQAAEAAALEEQTATNADGGSDAALAAVLAAATAGWVTAFGVLTAAGAGAALTAYLTKTRERIAHATADLDGRAARIISHSLDDAATLGARHAVEFAARAAGTRFPIPEVSTPREALEAARGAAAVVRAQLALSAELLSPRNVSSWRDVISGIGAARRAITLIRQTAAWAIHRAVNAGSQQAAHALGARALWVAEPTACVRCAAYSGRLADRDGHFPGGLSLDPHQRAPHTAAIDGPPIHPFDRCRIVPWRDAWTRPGRAALPDLLREQAWRSAASGHAQPSESRAARLRAAQYVSTLSGVPAGVRRQAHAAAAAGRF